MSPRVHKSIHRNVALTRFLRPGCALPLAIPLNALKQARIGHFVEAQILEGIEVDYIDESEVLTMADEDNHINKRKFTVPFVCGCRNLGEALVSSIRALRFRLANHFEGVDVCLDANLSGIDRSCVNVIISRRS